MGGRKKTREERDREKGERRNERGFAGRKVVVVLVVAVPVGSSW